MAKEKNMAPSLDHLHDGFENGNIYDTDIDELINMVDVVLSDGTKSKELFGAISTEMATVCYPGMLKGKKKCRIFIDENPNDHGKIGDGKRYIPDSQSPAHAHVYAADHETLLGKLNITGPRPESVDEVWEYRKPKESKLDDYREDIINWANGIDDETKAYNWTHIRSQWKLDHNPHMKPR